MPIDRLDLQDLMDERSRPAIERPAPLTSLRGRIDRARRRRRAAWAGAVIVSLVASGTVLGLRGPGGSDQTSVTVAAAFPAEYTESDGTVYRLVAEATLDAATREVTLDVAVRGKPLAIRAECPAERWPPQITVRVPESSKKYRLTPTPFLDCHENRAVDLMPLPQGTRRAAVTIEAHNKAGPERWRFGVYEWTPPATAKRPRPLPEPPATIGTWRLLGKAKGTWPATREVTITVPNTGRPMALVTYCGGDINRRLMLETRVNGRLSNHRVGCVKPGIIQDDGPRNGYATLDGDRKATTTVKVRLVTEVSDYRHRPGLLTAAVYEMPR
ncbi:hypothetical protein AB0I81_57365 [Nonomuraea sp. NPDC050404]|uniref:hypothetical protein n=1 Tax=Nonomuraea sp. NPDC050404 TaxID=3155783 RepID=UPI0033D65CB4